MEEQVKKAEQLSYEWHKGQVDKAGKEYYLHPKYVASLCKTNDEKIVAFLHDTMEDCGITRQDLLNQGFAEYIVDAIDCITHKENQTYYEYLDVVKTNEIAKKVKLCDLTHNMQLNRLPIVKEKDIARVERYLSYYKYLIA